MSTPVAPPPADVAELTGTALDPQAETTEESAVHKAAPPYAGRIIVGRFQFSQKSRNVH
jgi:hypothetical protein